MTELPLHRSRWRPLPRLTISDWKVSGQYESRYGYWRCRMGMVGIMQWRCTAPKPRMADVTYLEVIDSAGYMVSENWARILPDRTISRRARELLERIQP